MNFKKEEISKKSEYCLNCKIKPCQKGCPLNNDIPSIINLIKTGQYEEAYNVSCETTVLQSVCGRICPHKKQCEGACVRGIKNEPVDIGTLEAYIGDIAIEKEFKIEKEKNDNNSKYNVVVIGAGPAGLTCAAQLARKNINVTILEKYDKAGGILRRGIPDFRLDKKILDKQIAKILELGINIKYNQELGKDYKINDLINKYDAVFISIGANISANMGILGEQLNGVYGGNELLEKNNHPDYTNKKVAVIGGGNVAMDSARTIKRLGAKEVKVIYRRAEKQMPAEVKEIEDAKKEGVEFLFQNNIVKIIGKNKVEKIECIKTELVKKEGELRESPVDILGSNYNLDMDYVVMAIGAKPDYNIIRDVGVDTTKWGYIKVDEEYMTSKKGVFAGGDLAGCKATVAWASKSGREAAKSIIDFLNKEKEQ
mgnify:FL=1